MSVLMVEGTLPGFQSFQGFNQKPLSRLSITLNPEINCTVLNIDTSLTEHLYEFSIADPIFTIPRDSPNDNVIGKLSVLKEFHGIADLKQKRSLADTTNPYQTPNTYSILINVNIFQTGLGRELMQRWLFWYFKMKR